MEKVYKHAVEKQTIIVEELLDSAESGIDSIDWFVPHQANLRILQTTAKKQKLRRRLL